MSDIVGVFITWTTYGTWLPGDARGWRSRTAGHQLAKPELEEMAFNKLKSEPVLLKPHDRVTVESACRDHCQFRGWVLHAVNARSNHVHVVVSGYLKAQLIRDQLKANCTRALRLQSQPLVRERTWAKGGDCEILFNDDDLANAIDYVLNAQD